MLMVTITVTTQDVTFLDITVLMFCLLTEDVTSTHQHLMTAIHVDYLMASYILVRAITSPTTVRSLCFPPVTANATKIRLK